MAFSNRLLRGADGAADLVDTVEVSPILVEIPMPHQFYAASPFHRYSSLHHRQSQSWSC